MKYSAVIPVFNSEAIVEETSRRTIEFFRGAGLDYEIILVNDGSTDGSWQAIERIAMADSRVIAIDLLHNSGQHNANLCGFRHASGDWIVTLDDDLQNPPEEIANLIAAASDDHDLIMGRFEQKQHARYRKLGTLLIGWINRRIFHAEPDLVLSNFRLIRRDVVDRICDYRGPRPYVPGLCLLFSRQRANVLVRHERRSVGASNYTWRRILSLVGTILFNYSSFPLRLVAGAGILIAAGSFSLAAYFLVRGLLHGTQVPGWTTLAVMLAFFNGITLLILGMLGEYVVRIINQLTLEFPYHVRQVVRGVD